MSENNQSLGKIQKSYRLVGPPNNVEVGLCWYQKSPELKWSYDLTYHIMVELDVVIALANLTYDVETDTQVMKKSLTIL